MIVIAGIAYVYRPVTYLANALPSQVGRIEGTYRVVEEGINNRGYLVYGPYASFHPGKYKVQLAYTATSDESGLFDISFSGDSSWLVGENLLVRNNGLLSHNIKISKEDRGKALETRVFYSGKGTLKVIKITIRRLFTTRDLLFTTLIGVSIALLLYLILYFGFVRVLPAILIYLDLVIAYLKLLSSNIMLRYFSAMTRDNKIEYLLTILMLGFISSVVFHYIRAMFYNLGEPLNSFLPTPTALYCDYQSLVYVWTQQSFTAVTYALAYFPATYLIVDLISRIPFPWRSINPFMLIFIIFFIYYTSKNLRLDNKLTTIQGVILCLVSYPFLFTVHTSNVEIFVFIFLYIILKLKFVVFLRIEYFL